MRYIPQKTIIRAFTCAALICVLASVFARAACAYWIWTPETKKFVNPKYAVKDSPKEQFDWAMSFYDAKDFKRAAAEFEKLAKHYEFSEYASRAQYYAGLSYENMGKYYIAFQAYQKAVDNFPHTENLEDIIAKELNIANIYAGKPNPKVLGADIMTSTDRAIEIYRKVVENAPFGPTADEAQYKMGEVMKRSGMYEEATLAFQKIVDDYPTSSYADKAQYEVAQCAYKASLQPAYDAGPTDRALRIFEDYASSSSDEKLSEEAKRTMQRLKDKAAEKSMITAKFYEDQNHPKSAIIYYQDVIDRFPDSTHAPVAKAKIEKLQSAKAPERGGVFGWFKKRSAQAVAKAPEPSAPAPEASPEKKGWKPLSFFGKKEPKKAPQEQSVPQTGTAPSAAAGEPAPCAAASMASSPQAPLMPPANKGLDWMDILGIEKKRPQLPPPPVPVQPAPVAGPYAAAVAYEEKGSARANPRTDDPNVEMQDDDNI